MSAAAPQDRRWLFGPVPDLLFGCGLLYAAVFTVQALANERMQSVIPYALFPALTLLVGAPHYGATLMRVFEDRPAGDRYVRFTILLTLACLALFAVSLRSVAFGSIVLTVFLTWSPWHYSGQNYGVGLAFLRRRGIPFSPLAGRLFRGAFVTSFLLTALALHGADPSADYAPVTYRGTAFQLVPLGLARSWVEPLFLLTTIAFAVCSLGAAVLMLRGARATALLPTAIVWLTQTLWFFAPSVVRHWGLLPGIDPLAPENAAYTLMWVALGHFLQYLWFTSYFAVPGAPFRGKLGYLGKALLAGAALWVMPTVLFAPGLLGTLPYDFGLGVMAAAVVNLHHFILDGLIWKTSSGGRVRRLVADPALSSEPFGTPLRRLSPLVWIAGVVCAGIYFAGYWETEFGVRRALDRGDLGRFRTSIERSAWIGRTSPRHHVGLAELALDAGDLEGARRELDRSLALYPTAAAWAALGRWHEESREWREALDAYEQALALDANHADALVRTGQIWLRLGEPARAREPLLRAVKLRPDQRSIGLTLERAERELRESGGIAASARPATGD
jgi:hypothetical protein